MQVRTPPRSARGPGQVVATVRTWSCIGSALRNNAVITDRSAVRQRVPVTKLAARDHRSVLPTAASLRHCSAGEVQLGDRPHLAPERGRIQVAQWNAPPQASACSSARPLACYLRPACLRRDQIAERSRSDAPRSIGIRTPQRLSRPLLTKADGAGRSP